MKILLPVDGSSYTKRMLAWLTTHDEWLTGQHEYTVLTVVPQIPPHAAAMFPADQLKSYYEDTAEAIFKPIRKFTAKHDLATSYQGKIGHAPDVIARADETWSLGPLTLPHMLVRLVLAEQLYRAVSMLANHPYHRA